MDNTMGSSNKPLYLFLWESSPIFLMPEKAIRRNILLFAPSLQSHFLYINPKDLVKVLEAGECPETEWYSAESLNFDYNFT